MLVTLRGPYVGRIDHDIASRLSRTFDIDAELWIRIDENFFGQAIDRARGAQQ
jgi:plasmid maintenance system antidote protein VapI